MPHLQTRVAFLPFGPKSLKTLKPTIWKRHPATLGEILLKHRLQQGLRQRDLQERFGLDKATYANWEKDRCYPAMRHWQGIIKFLGFDPNAKPETLGEKLQAYRRIHGMSRRALAHELQVDVVTLWRWETGHVQPENLKHLEAIDRLMEPPSVARVFVEPKKQT
jgi:transcriptional regulator with XRE-family HTH domain